MTPLRYDNFDLMITALDTPKRYRAHVVKSPRGEASEEFDLPFSDVELEMLPVRAGFPGRGYRSTGSTGEWSAVEFGRRLYEAVFPGEIQTRLAESLAKVQGQKGLRIRLRLSQAPALTELPWEFLYAGAHGGFLAHSIWTPIVRYIDLPHPSRRGISAPLPLNILVMISNPVDRRYAALDVQAEWQSLQGAFERLQTQGQVQLTLVKQATLSALQQQLREGVYHVFHFIGHGAFDERTQKGVLILEDEEGQSKAVPGYHLNTFLRDHKSLRLALLNACEGARTAISDPFAGVAQQLVRDGLPAVIALQFDMTDQAALALAQVFYGVVASGHPVDYALAEARKAIYTAGNEVEWGAPVLHLRAANGQLFRVQPSRAEGGPAIRRNGDSTGQWAQRNVPEAAPDLDSALGNRPGAQQEQTNYPAAQQAVQKLRELRHTQLTAFVEEVLHLEKLSESPWQREEVRVQLKAALQSVVEPALSVFIHLIRLHRTYEDRESFCQQVLAELQTTAVIQALEWVYIDNPNESQARDMALQIATRLRPDVNCEFLHEYVRQEHWASLLLAWPPFTFWRERPATLHIRGIRDGGSDPFSAARAEDDPFLFPPNEDARTPGSTNRSVLLWRRRPPRLRRLVYRNLLTDATTLVIAPPGSGKTAAAILTAYELLVFQREQRNVLPVYWPLPATSITLQNQWRSFVSSHAKTLAAYVGASPHSYLESSLRHQNALAHLLALGVGTRQQLENFFYQLHQRNIDTLPRLFEQLHRHAGDMTIEQGQSLLADQERLLQLIGNAQPHSVQRFTLLIDVQGDNTPGDRGAFTTSLATIIDRLLNLGFAVNAFLAFEPGPELREQFTEVIQFDTPGTSGFKWSDQELRQLLQNRLLLIDDTQGGSLQTLVNADYPTIERLTGEIIRKSDGRPGRLLTIGRRLVRKCAEVGGRISPHAVDEILQEMDRLS